MFQFTLKMGSRTKWQKVRIRPSLHVLLNLRVFGSKNLCMFKKNVFYDSHSLYIWLSIQHTHTDVDRYVYIFSSCSPVSPQFFHHCLHYLTLLGWCLFSKIIFELTAIHFSKLLQGETPALQARAKPNCALTGVNLKKKMKYLLLRNS